MTSGFSLTKLERLVRSLEPNRFYSKHWGGVKLDDSAGAIEDFVHRIPVLNKSDVIADQEAEPPFGSRLNVRETELRQINVTGGTSGAGTEVYGLTGADVGALGRMFGSGVTAMGFPAGTKIAMTFPMSLSAAPQWIYPGLADAGFLVLPISSYGTMQKLQLMRDFDVDVLVATPSYAEYLAQTLLDAGLDPREELGLQGLIVATESLVVNRVEKLERVFGAKLYEWYGSTQRGMAFTCELGAVHEHSSGVLHIDHDSLFAEVRDVETGEPLIDPVTREPFAGKDATVIGELVVTFLDNEATPLVRYATSDLVHAVGSERCSCGRPGFGFISGSVSRLDGMLKVRGVSVDPARVDACVLGSRFVRDYRVRLTRTNGKEGVAVTVHAVDGAEPSEVVAEVGAIFHESSGLNAEVNLVEEDLEIFDDTRHKAKRWTDER